jgi:putative ABC transport system permease protein
VTWQLCIARLRPGATAAHAQAQMDTVATQLAAAYPQTNQKRGVAVDPLARMLRGELRDILFPLFGAVGFVLLIACTNVTNLLPARAALRRREIALRASIGAGRVRLMRQFLTDGMVLAIPAGLLGLVVARGGIELFKARIGQGFPYLDRIVLDWRVAGFTAIVATLVGVAVALAPAVQFSRPDLAASLKEGGRGAVGGRQRARSILVIGQIALAGILLAGAGMTLSALRTLYGLRVGFDAENLLTMHVHLSGPRYSRPGPPRPGGVTQIDPRVEKFYDELLAKVRAIPGVRSVSVSSWIPDSRTGEGKRDRDFEIEERPTEPNRPHPNARMYNMVSPSYLETLGIPLLRGRFISDHDVANSPWVAVVNNKLAKQFFPGEDPIGKHVRILTVEEERPRQIVGVVSDVLDQSTEPRPEMYVSFVQQPELYPGYGTQPRLGRQLVIRTGGLATGIAERVQKMVREMDPAQLVFDVKTMKQRMAETYDGETFIGTFLGAFAGLALLLAAIGIYGVMSYTVAQRRHEIGVRIALGADRARILRLVLKQGMGLTAVGLAIAAAASVALSRLIGWLTFGVRVDSAAFVWAGAVLLATALVAAIIPGRRATAVDAAEALRAE